MMQRAVLLQPSSENCRISSSTIFDHCKVFTIFWWSLVITISWWWSLFVARWKSACNKLWNTTDGGPCFWRPMRQDCETVPRHLKFREKKKDLFKGRIVMILGCISKEGGGAGVKGVLNNVIKNCKIGGERHP